MLHTTLIASSTEAQPEKVIKVMQQLLRLPQDVGNKIYFMWHDIIANSDSEAAQDYWYQYLNDREREIDDWHGFQSGTE